MPFLWKRGEKGLKQKHFIDVQKVNNKYTRIQISIKSSSWAFIVNFSHINTCPINDNRCYFLYRHGTQIERT